MVTGRPSIGGIRVLRCGSERRARGATTSRALGSASLRVRRAVCRRSPGHVRGHSGWRNRRVGATLRTNRRTRQRRLPFHGHGRGDRLRTHGSWTTLRIDTDLAFGVVRLSSCRTGTICPRQATFLVDGATPLHEACRRHGLDFRDEQHGNRSGVERVFREGKRRTASFSNCFSHADPATADEWLRSFAVAWNQLI
ncbi:IS240-type transposase (ISH102) [Halococcus salifodinae DSM 8989]|uniref:IS240-type transposase (ISH102) n=1 Tax=Halococcus salifodinae DSM 8989 TaxID=1227456 RepID=M0N8P3_9EURY|nr:IS240-type transposase (ISH102) [Halococcus salifodinae DSM 8989]